MSKMTPSLFPGSWTPTPPSGMGSGDALSPVKPLIPASEAREMAKEGNYRFLPSLHVLSSAYASTCASCDKPYKLMPAAVGVGAEVTRFAWGGISNPALIGASDINTAQIFPLPPLTPLSVMENTLAAIQAGSFSQYVGDPALTYALFSQIMGAVNLSYPASNATDWMSLPGRLEFKMNQVVAANVNNLNIAGASNFASARTNGVILPAGTWGNALIPALLTSPYWFLTVTPASDSAQAGLQAGIQGGPVPGQATSLAVNLRFRNAGGAFYDRRFALYYNQGDATRPVRFLVPGPPIASGATHANPVLSGYGPANFQTGSDFLYPWATSPRDPEMLPASWVAGSNFWYTVQGPAQLWGARIAIAPITAGSPILTDLLSC